MESKAHERGIHPYWGKRWVEKLRTTTAPQIRGTGFDEETGGMCAVGVLVNELILDGVLADWPRPGESDATLLGKIETLDAIVPYGLRREVVNMNDLMYRPFAEIADAIEPLIEPPIDRATRDAYPALLVEREKAGVTR